MCDVNTENKIREVVQLWTDNNCLFTAYQVHKEVCQKLLDDSLPTEPYRHTKRTIHSILSDYVDTGEYEKELRDVGGPVKAFVYFPVGKDVNEYDPNKVVLISSLDSADPLVYTNNNNVPRSVAVSPSPMPSMSVSVRVKDDLKKEAKGLTVDARGTLCIPAFLVKMAGFAGGSPVNAWIDVVNGISGLGLTLASSPVHCDKTTSYTVDKYGNVRVTKYMLSNLGVSNSYNAFLVEDNGTKGIVVLKS